MFNTAEEYTKKFEELKAEKEEHLAMIGDIENSLKILEKEFEVFKQTASQNREIKNAALQVRQIYNSYVDVGFSSEEAFKLVSTMMMGISNENLSQEACMAIIGGF
jgi:hypothetical protein